MKKFVALALFAVMALMMIPAANAYDGETAIFVAKNYYDEKDWQQYVGETEEDHIAIVTDPLNKGNVYAAEFDAASLVKSYADKYDSVGKAYYYVIIPVPTEIATGTFEWTSVKLNGEELLFANMIKGTEMVDGDLCYIVGYADVANGFNKTYTWTATNGTTSTTVKYTVKLTEKAAPVAPTALNYNIAGEGEGYAIYTKKGIVYVDFAADYIAEKVDTTVALDAVLTLTVNGKNPIPANEFGYLTIDENNFSQYGVDVILDKTAYRNTDTIKLTVAKELDIEVGETLYEDGAKMSIALDTRGTQYLTKDIKVVFRAVEVGDPKGIVINEGDVLTVGLNEKFTLTASGKEATLMKSIKWGTTDSKQILLQDGNSFVAIEEGVQYVVAQYEYDHEIYTDTIKIIVAEEPATTSYYVVCRALNVRKGPSTSYGKVGLVYRNDIVDVISVADGWAKIWFDGAERYVSTKYIAAK